MGTEEGAVTYEIVIGAALPEDWSDWFDGLSVRTDGDTTVLSGAIADQTSLHGLLRRIRDLGIPLLGLNACGERQIHLRAHDDPSGPS